MTFPVTPNGQIRGHSTGSPVINSGENNTTLLCTDRYGRAWARLHSGTAPISPTNPLPVDIIGDMAGATWVDPGALANTAVAYVGATTLHVALAMNTVATGYYFQVFDLAVALVGGEIPKFSNHLPATGSYSLSVSRAMTNGIVWAISTSPAVYTAVPGAFAWVNVAHIP